MSCQIVFNLYPVTDALYLPSAYIVRTDDSGQLTHFVQKATPATIGAYGSVLTPALQRLFDCVETLSPKSLEAKFKPPKSKTTTPLLQLLAQPETRRSVESYLHRELDLFLAEVVRHQFPLSLDAERRTLVKDVQLHPAAAELVPYLSFRKTMEGVEYRFRLGTETEQWNIREFDVLPLTNTSPAWIVANYTLFRVPGVNGNMVRPFRTKDVLHIPPDKVNVYFRQFIAKNAGRTEIEAEGFEVLTANRLIEVQLEPTENILERNWLLRPVFVYDGARFYYGDRRDRVTSLHIPGEHEPGEIVVHRIVRDQEAEKNLLEKLLGFGLVEDQRTFRLPKDNTLSDYVAWLSRHRPALQAAGFSPASPQVEGRALALWSFSISVQPQAVGDWFDVHGQVEIGEFRFPFKAFVPYLRNGNPYFPLPDDTFFLIPEEWFARYGELARALREEKDGLRLPKTLFTLLQESVPTEVPDTFPVVDPDLVDYQPSPNLRATLRPYQQLGVRWLIGHYKHGFGACLADDMGLGKTLQTIAALLYIKEEAPPAPPMRGGVRPSGSASMEGEPCSGGGRKGSTTPLKEASQLSLFSPASPLRALIVLPASLVFNWQRELAQFAPNLFLYPHTGPRRMKDLRAIAAHDVVLTTYQTARQDLDLLGKVAWNVIVLDESQQIKNRESEVSKVVRSLDGRFKISLSGTPVENSLADLWTQMEFINPDTLGSFSQFREEFLLPIERAGDDAAKQRLFARIRPFFLRRTKEEVAPDLPALTEQVFYSEMSAAQRKLYEKVKSAVRNEILNLFDDPKTRLLALQALTRLRQLANHPALVSSDDPADSGKFDDVLAQWETVRRSGHKVLFFSSFEKHLQLFRRVFEASNQPFAWLTGDTASAERARQVERFQRDGSVQAFFMTVKAGGVGLNLTAADYVFVLDPWWNPAVEDQAIARAHRIGQSRPVTALRFIARDTIEEKIRQMQERKKALGKDFFAAGGETPVLSREELEDLLR